MKAIAYSIKPEEKEFLAVANGKKHDLTLISNELNMQTLAFAHSKDAVIVAACDILDVRMLLELKNVGVTKIITRSSTTAHIDLKEATQMGFNIANVPGGDQTLEGIAQKTIHHLNAWDKGKCVGSACCCQNACGRETRRAAAEKLPGNYMP